MKSPKLSLPSIVYKFSDTKIEYKISRSIFTKKTSNNLLTLLTQVNQSARLSILYQVNIIYIIGTNIDLRKYVDLSTKDIHLK